MKNPNFEAFEEKKVEVVWKNVAGQKMHKIIQKIDFFALEVVKTTSRLLFFGQNWFFKKIDFLKIFSSLIKNSICKHLQNILFDKNFESRNSQLSYALSSVTKYFKMALLSSKDCDV